MAKKPDKPKKPTPAERAKAASDAHKTIARNKKAVTLNFGRPQGQEILRSLVADADVLVDALFGIGLHEAPRADAAALIEALDAFEAEKARRRAAGDAPLHEVRLSVLGGASAGGMCAALGAVFLDAGFPHVTPEADASADS